MQRETPPKKNFPRLTPLKLPFYVIIALAFHPTSSLDAHLHIHDKKAKMVKTAFTLVFALALAHVAQAGDSVIPWPRKLLGKRGYPTCDENSILKFPAKLDTFTGAFSWGYNGHSTCVYDGPPRAIVGLTNKPFPDRDPESIKESKPSNISIINIIVAGDLSTKDLEILSERAQKAVRGEEVTAVGGPFDMWDGLRIRSCVCVTSPCPCGV